MGWTYFILCRKTAKVPSPRKMVPLQPELNIDASFSIVYRGDQTMDLTVLQDQDGMCRDEIVKVLNYLLHVFNCAKTQVGNDIFHLRYLWVDVDKVGCMINKMLQCGAESITSLL